MSLDKSWGTIKIRDMVKERQHQKHERMAEHRKTNLLRAPAQTQNTRETKSTEVWEQSNNLLSAEETHWLL